MSQLRSLTKRARASAPRSVQVESGEDKDLGLERIEFFSDAVMAIALTLLAIDLRVPEVSAASAPLEMPQRLVEMSPRFLSFLVSFSVIGVYWISHHRYFGFIKRYDGRLMLLNLVFLLFIVLMPFTSSLLGQYPALPLSTAAYALNVGAIGSALYLMWHYATRSYRLVDSHLERGTIRLMTLRALTAPVLFFTSIPFAFISPLLTTLWWVVGTGLVSVGLREYARRNGLG